MSQIWMDSYKDCFSLPCGHTFSVSHAFSCSKGAMPTLRHNAIRDITAQLLTVVCPNIGVEPQLQPLSGETFQYRTANTDECSHLDNQAKTFGTTAIVLPSCFCSIQLYMSFHQHLLQIETQINWRRDGIVSKGSLIQK